MLFRFQKLVKGENMKKALLVVLALLLAMPAVSYAGSATSRWDLVIGGYAKMVVSWSNRNMKTQSGKPPLEGVANRDNLDYETGNMASAASETRFNFLARGPDAFGAKVSIFVEGDFDASGGSDGGNFANGVAGTDNETQLFRLRHAYGQMTWPNTILIVGKTDQAWGQGASFRKNGKGTESWLSSIREEQIMVKQTLAKNLVLALQAGTGYQTDGAGIGQSKTGSALTHSMLPNFAANLEWSSQACGALGKDVLKVGIGGVYGWYKYKYDEDLTATISAASENYSLWGSSLYFVVPIIPERNKSKAGGLMATGLFVYGQGLNNYAGDWAAPYLRRTGVDQPIVPGNLGQVANPDLSASQNTLWAFGASFYLTDQLQISSCYGEVANHGSARWRAANSGDVRSLKNGNLVLTWDPSPAFQYVLSYERYWLHTAAPTATRLSRGKAQEVRLGATYFF